MTDLINNVDKIIKDDIQSIQNLATKYKDILAVIPDQKQIPYLAYIIDICVNHINEHHDKQTPDRKSWAVVVVKNLFTAGKIKKDNDIPFIINEFIKYAEDEFEEYATKMVAVSQYDLELGFVFRFVRQKIH